MISYDLLIESDGPTLEGVLEIPDLPPPLPAVLLCHPHPMYGGNMNNNVVIGVGRKLIEKGFAVLRFNSRGVGRSTGYFDEGIGEVDDARACISYLRTREEIDPGRLGIFGYSFGGVLAFSAVAREDTVKALAGISPVLSDGALKGCLKPMMIICGSEDNVVPVSSVLKEIDKAGGSEAINLEMQITDGADHFWWGYEKEVGETIARFFSKNLA